MAVAREATSSSQGEQPATATEVIGLLLDAVTAENRKLAPVPEDDPRVDFECVVAPEQAVSAYLERFYQFRSVDNLWVMGLCMLHRLQTAKEMPIAPRTVHRLMACALTVAVKAVYEAGRVNALVADFGGVALDDLNDMELTFLELIDWDINVWREEYDIIVRSLPQLEEYATQLLDSATELEGPAMVLPESIAQEIAAARADIRNRSSVVKSPVVLSPLHLTKGRVLVSAPLPGSRRRSSGFCAVGHWPSTPPLPVPRPSVPPAAPGQKKMQAHEQPHRRGGRRQSCSGVLTLLDSPMTPTTGSVPIAWVSVTR